MTTSWLPKLPPPGAFALSNLSIKPPINSMEYQMKLLVGEDESRVEIDTVPQVMATASPVFRRMLQPDRFIEGRKLSENKAFTVPLPEDEPAAMKVLCDILHFRSDKVPMKDMTPTLLASIATIVDKYDCAIAIQPWPKLWLSPLLSPLTPWNGETMPNQELTMWIHTTCHLGYEDQFRLCTSSLIRRASKSDLQGEKEIPGYGQLSEIVRSRIQSARDSCVLKFQELCSSHIKYLKKGKSCINSHSSTAEWSIEESNRSRVNCSALLLGSAILAAQEVCEDWENVENWRGSPAHYYAGMLNFAERLTSVRKVEHTLQRQWGGFGGETKRVAHNICGLSESIRKQVDTIYAALLPGLKLSDIGNRAYRKDMSGYSS